MIRGRIKETEGLNEQCPGITRECSLVGFEDQKIKCRRGHLSGELDGRLWRTNMP